MALLWELVVLIVGKVYREENTFFLIKIINLDIRLNQLKKTPAMSPVNNMARAKMIVSVFIKLFKIYTKINSINFKTVNKW